MSHGESHFKNKDKIVYFKAVLIVQKLKIEPPSVYFTLFYKTTFPQNRIKIVYFTGYFVVWYNKTGIK